MFSFGGIYGTESGFPLPRPLRTLQICLSAANFTPIPVSSTGRALTFPHQGGRDFQTPIRGYAKVFFRGNDGFGVESRGLPSRGGRPQGSPLQHVWSLKRVIVSPP